NCSRPTIHRRPRQQTARGACLCQARYQPLAGERRGENDAEMKQTQNSRARAVFRSPSPAPEQLLKPPIEMD
ncbi:Hypothetical predicted protein, partial [Lynx pardinus]